MNPLRIRIHRKDDGSLVMVFEDDRGVLHVRPITEEEAREHEHQKDEEPEHEP